MKLQLNREYGLYEHIGQAFCDSLQIAETFEKRHDHVLRDIENTIQVFNKINQPKFGEINFIPSTYKDGRGRKQPRYLLTKDGFNYIAMGFDGERAALYKIGYIRRFNQMEAFIEQRITGKLEYPAFTEAVMLAHAEPKHYHFSTELNMIYRIVLGVDAKKYREQHGLEAGAGIKSHLTLEQLKAVETLQRVDIGLLEIEPDYDRRKAILTNRYQRMIARLTA